MTQGPQGPLKTPCSRSSHALPQPLTLVVHCTDWDPAPSIQHPAPSCSAQDLRPAMLTTARGQPAPCHSERTKALCCFPGEPWRRALGCCCFSVLTTCPHHASRAAQPSPFAPWRANTLGRWLGHQPGMKHPLRAWGREPATRGWRRQHCQLLWRGNVFFISACHKVGGGRRGDKREHGSASSPLGAFLDTAS